MFFYRDKRFLMVKKQYFYAIYNTKNGAKP